MLVRVQKAHHHQPLAKQNLARVHKTITSSSPSCPVAAPTVPPAASRDLRRPPPPLTCLTSPPPPPRPVSPFPFLSLLLCAHSGDLGLGFGELGAVELRIPLSRVLGWFLKLKIGLCSRDLDSGLDSLVLQGRQE
ncbi:uncharacterized protein A4U43_C03F12620 [Asparagus officinalis]|uniref:Uncharacterized protein n=1 Tax=Asparagus officinalis TaxID=4686 RepID=A0A5P1FA36_ASPOF|nr:uncharacterized protein A4U43_C03F12620 [Asparagus officinalis]